jgi:hypothetical protein
MGRLNFFKDSQDTAVNILVVSHEAEEQRFNPWYPLAKLS